MIVPSDYPQKSLNNYYPKIDSYDNEDPDESESLRRLLQVHGLFGITYCGNTPLGKRQTIKKIFAIAYDLGLIVLYIATTFLVFNEDNFRRLLQNSKNKGAMSFIFNLVGFSLAIEYLTIKLMLLVNGSQLIETISSIGFVKSKRQMYLLWTSQIIAVLMITFANTINFIDLDQSFTRFYNEDRLKAFILTVNSIFHSVVKLSILSLLLYSSFVISQQLDGIALNFETNSIGSPKKISQKVIELSRKIERLNKLTGPIMLVKIATSSFSISGGICALAIGNLKVLPKIGILIFALISLIDITIGCRSSQLIINSMINLCKAVENSISNKTYFDEDYQQLKLILSLRGYFNYGVCNLFDLKDVTILLAISYITNYAVILIQTQ